MAEFDSDSLTHHSICVAHPLHNPLFKSYPWQDRIADSK